MTIFYNHFDSRTSSISFPNTTTGTHFQVLLKPIKKYSITLSFGNSLTSLTRKKTKKTKKMKKNWYSIQLEASSVFLLTISYTHFSSRISSISFPSSTTGTHFQVLLEPIKKYSITLSFGNSLTSSTRKKLKKNKKMKKNWYSIQLEASSVFLLTLSFDNFLQSFWFQD